MQQIKEEQSLPRFYKDFIGIGHHLEQKRRERRLVELEERAVANRVLFLEKEETKAQKDLLKKKEKLSNMMKVAQRQAHEKDLKQQKFLQREKDLQLAKEENHLRRILHKQNLQRQEHEIYRRNSMDYRLGKQQLIQGQSRKKSQRREDMVSRQERYMTLNERKDQGRTRIDKFFKKKNFEHTKTYREKIRKEESQVSLKKETIVKLTQIQGELRKRLEQSSQRVSQLDQVLGSFQNSMRERTRSRSKSRLSLNRTLDMSPKVDHNQPSLITSVEGQLLLKKDDIEQKLQTGTEGMGAGASEGSKVRHRRRNKHVNRYLQYQQY